MAAAPDAGALTRDPALWRQAKDVLAEVLTCPASQRDALLQLRCPDPALRREVESYLSQYDPNFLETVITISEFLEQPDAPREVVELAPGTKIGPYVVIDRLGIGGMGQVFLGSDPRLHRRVALKCLLSTGSIGDVRSKILHEARAAARINHPNIATVHDVIEDDGRVFLVMEYVEGDSLASVLRRERMAMDRVLAIGRQLASALAAAHAKGIIHRDLKPANVQVMPDGAVKVLDFGVAQAVSVGTVDSTAHTTADRLDRRVPQPGTPAYMSPEQMLGREVDHRSDIYSLGVILYEMATGRRPYASTDALELVVTLSKRLLRADAADPRVPRELSDVIARALAINPEERYQTAAELGADLESLEHEFGGDRMRPAVRPARASRASTRAVAVGAVALLPVGLGLLGFMSTAIYNQTLGRTPPFDREAPSVWVAIGARSLVAPTLYGCVMLIIVATVSFAMRLLMLSDRLDHLLTTSRARTRVLSVRLGLNDPAILGQAVAGIGFVAVAVTAWRFWPTIWACVDNVNFAPAEQLARLQLGNRSSEASLYRLVLAVITVGLGTAVVRLARLRGQYSMRRAMPAIALVVVTLTLTVVMSEIPYRLVWRNQSERVEYAGQRCYVIGTSRDQSLLFCPDRVPPRSRIVANDDPALHRLGIVENIFNPPDMGR